MQHTCSSSVSLPLVLIYLWPIRPNVTLHQQGSEVIHVALNPICGNVPAISL